MYEEEDKLYIFARQSIPDVAEALLHVDKQLARGQTEMVHLVNQRRALLGRAQALANERFEIEKTARVLCINDGRAPDAPMPGADDEDTRPAWVHYVEAAQGILNKQKAPANEDTATTQLSRAVDAGALAPAAKAGNPHKPVTLTRSARRIAAAKARRKQ